MLRRFGFGREPLSTVGLENLQVAPTLSAEEETVSGEENDSKDQGSQDGNEKLPPTDDEAAVPTAEAQSGVKTVEAVTLTWDKTALICIYACNWSLYATNAFQSSITANLSPYVLSGFESHSLVPIIYLVSSSMTAAMYMPLAKILDLWGRAEGLLCMAVCAELGLILMATTTNVSTYCAAQVFYSLGFSGIIYSVDVLTSDTSKLQNRGIAFAFTSSPYMITALAGPKISERFYEMISWRWAFGMFTIILPVVVAPLFYLLKVHERRAKKAGLLVREKSGRTTLQSIWHYVIEFDGLGVFLLASGLVIFLLPFSLADAAPQQWKTGYIIGMLVLGFVLLIAFGFYECFFAPKALLPYHLLLNRTVLGVVLLNMSYQSSYYCFSSYFSSFLQVVKDLSISEAGYVTGIFDIVSGVLLFGVGFLIRKTGYFRWLLMIAVPLYLLALGLLVKFRTPSSSLAVIIVCQVFQAIAGSTMILCQQVGIMAASDHQHIAAVLGLLSTSAYIAGAVGSAVSSAIWTNTFPNALERLLPEESLESFADIYGDLSIQMSYPVGDPTRIAIQEAYGYAQRRMLIAGLAFSALALVWVLMMKNIEVRDSKQTKGTLF